ncbi:serine/threonine-protein kinase [Nocardioides zeicaulis]|uniref:non-specific serine/threonine protein kinase n=2 Tax=Nocardioides zeicaulis TaxID=1776857 RepID=A0ABV6E3X6_9ACTN
MIAGRYTLEREIGRGGAGSVHLAHDELLDRSVAIKRIGLLAGTTDQDIARAEREARLAAGINHPHVVSIFDLVKDVDCYWLVMELVRGRTLTEVVRADGPLPVTRAAGILAQAADALVQAGRAGIVHRDVKPGNIMVDDDHHTKLGDFGIARAGTDAALTQTGFITGSPAYIAPEVASGAPASAASDVWSLGGTLYFALTGRAPYEVGDNIMGGLYRIVHGEPPRLPHDHPLAGLLAVMMAKDPADRWPVERVRDDLRRAAHGEASTAPTPPVDQGPDATRPLGTTPAPTPRDEPTRTSAVPAAPVARAPHADTVPRDEPSWRPLRWLAAALTLVVLGVVAWLLWPGDGERAPGDAGATRSEGRSADGRPSSSEEPSQEPSASTSSTATEPTDPAGSAPASAGAPPAMRAFVEDYFATVTSDPEAAFDMLTPEFQEASGGYERYAGFWSTIESASPSGIRVDPEALTASYTIDYATTSGRTTTQQVTLQLEKQGEDYLIAGEA